MRMKDEPEVEEEEEEDEEEEKEEHENKMEDGSGGLLPETEAEAAAQEPRAPAGLPCSTEAEGHGKVFLLLPALCCAVWQLG